MNILSDLKLKKIELGVLKNIDMLCRQQGYHYSLCGGTLLGAIRHRGFIPWDDDIDIAMPRKDYDSFINYCIRNVESLDFEIISSRNHMNYGYLFAKACAKKTTIIEHNTNRAGIKLGVHIDIFPIDGLGKKEEAQRHFKKMQFRRELLVAYNWNHFFKSSTHSWYVEPIRFVFYLISRFINPQNQIDKIEAYYKKFLIDDSECAAIICGSYRLHEIMPMKVLNCFSTVEFEGQTFCAFSNYHSYLSSIYGDYMKLPPKEEQISHHTFTALQNDII